MKRYMLGYSIEMHYVGVDSADTAKLTMKHKLSSDQKSANYP